MLTAVQIGAGKIGRGFLGPLLRRGDYGVVFVDSDARLVERMNARRCYPLRLVTEGSSETVTIDGFRALDAEDDGAVASLVAADLVCTAVGVANLPAAARQLAQGINARAAAGAGSVDILLCENEWHAAALMRDCITPHVAPQARGYFHEQVGLVETVIGVMVPVPMQSMQAEDPLLLVTEPFGELPVARDMLRGAVPGIPGLILAAGIEAYEARKLYLHNMSHAALAYLGYRRGHEYIWQCAEDGQVADVCQEALQETSRAVSDRYGFPREALKVYCTDLLRRFANKALADTVARVGADPLRKLRPSDRLVGALGLCGSMGTGTDALSKIIAAALLYDNPADAAAAELQRRRRSQGDEAVLAALCGLRPAAPSFFAVRAALSCLDTQKERLPCP